MKNVRETTKNNKKNKKKKISLNVEIPNPKINFTKNPNPKNSREYPLIQYMWILRILH
jgi:hypothetical protein